MCPTRDPELKYLCGLWLFLFKRYLKDATEGTCFISSGRLFQEDLIAEGKKNYKKDLY